MQRLRKREERARVHARVYQVIASALRRRLGQDRRLDLEEGELAEHTPGALRQPVAHDEIRLQLGAPEIEVPVLEAQLFGGELVALAARHRDCWWLGRSRDLERERAD